MSGVEWDDENQKHTARHGITSTEFEEAFLSSRLDLDHREVHGELRYASIGETARGRILVVVVTERASRIRPVTAFEPGKHLLNLYLKSRAHHG